MMARNSSIVPRNLGTLRSMSVVPRPVRGVASSASIIRKPPFRMKVSDQRLSKQRAMNLSMAKRRPTFWRSWPAARAASWRARKDLRPASVFRVMSGHPRVGDRGEVGFEPGLDLAKHAEAISQGQELIAGDALVEGGRQRRPGVVPGRRKPKQVDDGAGWRGDAHGHPEDLARLDAFSEGVLLPLGHAGVVGGVALEAKDAVGSVGHNAVRRIPAVVEVEAITKEHGCLPVRPV